MPAYLAPQAGLLRHRWVSGATGGSDVQPRPIKTKKTIMACSCGLTVELSCGPAAPVRTNTRHCTGRAESAARRAARSAFGGQRVVRPRGAGARACRTLSRSPTHPSDKRRLGNEQTALHVVALARLGSAFPHSLHTSDSPRGYAHAGQRLRRTRMNRRRLHHMPAGRMNASA